MGRDALQGSAAGLLRGSHGRKQQSAACEWLHVGAGLPEAHQAAQSGSAGRVQGKPLQWVVQRAVHKQQDGRCSLWWSMEYSVPLQCQKLSSELTSRAGCRASGRH